MLRRHLLPKYAELRKRGFLEQFRQLMKSQYYSRREIANLQEEKMRRLVTFAYQNVPFYREVFRNRGLSPSDFRSQSDLQKLPILTKHEIQHDFNRLLSTEPAGAISIRRTSGSTGRPYKVVVDQRCQVIEAAIFFRFLSSIGYEWGDRVIKLWGAPIVHSEESKFSRFVKTQLSQTLWNHRWFDTYKLDHSTVEKILFVLEQSPSSILRGYVSSVYLIALEALHCGLRTQLKAVTTTAEKLFTYQRQAIERAFGQKIYDQYGCGESNAIAFECEEHNGLHVASEHVIVEILDEKGEAVSRGSSGRVIITDLDNYAMPLIRYENGDLASWSKHVCPCGRGLPVLERIEGRAYEVMDVPGGRKIHGGFFDEIYVEMKLGDRYVIDDVRVVQEDLLNYRLEFVMNEPLSEEEVWFLRQKYKEYLGDVNLKIRYVERIPVTKTGKRMFVIPSHELQKSG